MQLKSSLKVHTYVNTPPPHPAIAVKSLGPRSLAGLIAYPQLYPKVAPITNTTRPIMTGIEPLSGVLLLLSIMAKTQPTNRAVPNTYEIHGHILVLQCFLVYRETPLAYLSMPAFLSVDLSVCLLPVYLPVYLFVCLPVYLSA